MLQTFLELIALEATVALAVFAWRAECGRFYREPARHAMAEDDLEDWRQG